MSGFDQNRVFFNTENENGSILKSDANQQEKSNEKLQRRFLNFINSFKRGNETYYREQLLKNYSLNHFYLEIGLEDLAHYDDSLYNCISNDPIFYLGIFEESAREAVKVNLSNRVELDQIPSIQILIMGDLEPLPLRRLTASHVSKLVCVCGIVISSSRIQARVLSYSLRCMSCGDEITIFSNSNYFDIPKRCIKNPQGNCTSYTLLPEKAIYVDQQILKIQEAPETIPTGELPRHAQLLVERNLVGRAVPGTRVIIMGVSSLYNAKADGIDNASIRMSYIKALGMEVNAGGLGRTSKKFTEDEVKEIKVLSKDPKIYQKIVEKIAPVVYGHRDIKCALTCQLFGGCSKVLPDSTRLRGDINILLLGDPGTAKSQMLKFVECMAPIGVYTSGKGSSAAGLTASVVRDPQSREFYLEGGAMVLADGGIVCIDEFDKMRKQDRVAIHEAMEQQTISIAKAGITTILNARTAVFAAANPSFGAYDEGHTASENFNEFRSTILSRFDAIFLIKDTKDQERDISISKHILDTHIDYHHLKNKNSLKSANDEFQKLKRYILYCRQNCFPRLTEGASKELVDYYLLLRRQYKSREKSGEGNVIPITVRQLEAIIRFSEALAKMSLSPFATETHVTEAIRIFTVSSIEATNSGKVVMEMLTDSMRVEVENIEIIIRRKLPIDSSMRLKSLIAQLSKNFDFSETAINRTILIMVQREELEFRNNRRIIHRKK